MARIAWLIPKLIDGSGGHRTMFQNIQALVDRGHQCTAYIEPDDPIRPIHPRDHALAAERAVSLFGPTHANIRAGFRVHEPFDLIFATAWYTARIVHDLPASCPKAYFVQDYEAWFNPVGDTYLMAEDSYRLGLQPVTIGRWLTHKLHAEFGAVCNYFDFCADRQVYKPDPSIPKQKAICFICQPEKPRRCTRLGLEALRILKHYIPDVQIYLFGSSRRAPVCFDCTELGLLSIRQCNALYNQCRAGLCLSSSNPSRIPFEMMAAGLPVVDIYRENNLYDVQDEGVLLAQPTPDSLAKALAMILSDESRRSQMSSAATRFMADRDLATGFNQFVTAVEMLLSRAPVHQPDTPRLYTQPGVHAETTGELAALCGRPILRGSAGHASFEAEAARADLADIENSLAWRLMQRIKRTTPYRVLADYRFGRGWDQVHPDEPVWERLARIKASRAYRVIHAVKSGRVYRWCSRRKRPPRAGSAGETERVTALRSVDVWDTLLRRRCHPDEVKLHTARLLLLKHFESLHPECRTAWNLLEQRVRCEADAGFRERARGNDDEYNIEGVFKEWLQAVLKTDSDEAQVRELAQELIEAEIQQEIRVSCQDDTIGSHLTRGGDVPLVLISDFYMNSDQLGRIVRHHCPDLQFSRLFTSSELNLNKRSGRLFHEVQRQFGVAATTHHHLGDNAEADVRVPVSQGVRAELYVNAREEERRERNRRRFTARRNSIARHVDNLYEDLKGVCVPADLTREQRRLFELGLHFSPLCCGYVEFAIEEAMKSGASRMFYFTREGEFFRQIHDALSAADALGTPLPAGTVIEISRLATFFASMRDISVEELMRIWTLYSRQSMFSLFRTLDLDPQEFGSQLAAVGLPLEEEIEHPWTDSRVRRLFASPEFLGSMESRRSERRRLVYGYLQAKGVTPELDRLFIVDVGWRGTIQDNLAHLLPRTAITGCYLGLFRFLNPQPSNVRKLAYGPDENAEGLSVAESIQFVSPFEMVANSPFGSVLRYEEQNGTVQAVREIDPDENAVYERYTRHFQAGVLAAAPVFADWIRHHAISAQELRPHVLDLMSQLQHDPPPVLARAFFSLSHNETFGVGSYVSKRTRFPLALAAGGVLSRHRASQFLRYIESTGWPQGFLNYYRLRPLCRLYNGYSRARARRREAELTRSTQA